MDLEKLVSNVATGEKVEYSADDIKGFADELKTLKSTSGNQDEINSLKEQLETEKKAHEELKVEYSGLKNRIVDKLFSNDSGKPSEPDDKVKKEKEKDDKSNISFKDLIKPDYRIR